MSEPNLEMFIDPDIIAELHNQAEIKFPDEEVGISLNNTSCCGGVIHIDLMRISEIQSYTDVVLVFPADYKDFGLPIFIDKNIMQEPIPRMRIILSSSDPIKIAFENNDFYQKEY